jgi:NAD(P)-dependent dehydrogenase (short-subunit alcohol dehydrogenase family)
VDILVNNAGIARIAPIVDLSLAQWEETIAVNLRAPFLLAQALAPKMIEQRSGKIINISSQAGVIALDEHAAYCTSKGGMNMLTKVMAVEWGAYNIQVNAVAPTVILTPMGVEVWGDPAKSCTDAGQDSIAPFWSAGRGGRPGALLGCTCVRLDHRRDDLDRRRIHRDLRRDLCGVDTG